MTTEFRYRAYGLNIESDFDLPELPPATEPMLGYDLHIERCEDETTNSDCEADSIFRATVGGSYDMHVRGVATYCVSNGSHIRLSPLANADLGMLRLYLIGSAFGMALHQRGLLVLHASAVLRGSSVTLFVGESGFGKSTIAAQFGQRGNRILADDVMPVHFGSDGGGWVWPGSLAIKLWADSIDALGIERVGLVQVANRTEKYFVSNSQPAPDAPYLIGEIVVLENVLASQEPSLQPLPRLEAIRAIAENTYRSEYVDLLDHRTEHFRQSAQLAASVPVLRLRRQWDAARIGEVMDLIEGYRPG